MNTKKKNKGRPVNLPRTAAEALAAGWSLGDTAWARGYVSRRSTSADWGVRCAGGHRTGYYYYNSPSWGSTMYCERQYIYPPAGWAPEYAADTGAED